MELEVPRIGFGTGRRTFDLQRGNGSLLCLVLLLRAVVMCFLLPPRSVMQKERWQELSQCGGIVSIVVLG